MHALEVSAIPMLPSMATYSENLFYEMLSPVITSSMIFIDKDKCGSTNAPLNRRQLARIQADLGC